MTLGYELATPNGCLVYSAFNTLPIILVDEKVLDGHDPADAERFFTAIDQQTKHPSLSTVSNKREEMQRMRKIKSGLDYIDLDPTKVYENVTKRIGINCMAVRDKVFNVFDPNDTMPIEYTQRQQERLISRPEDLPGLGASFEQATDQYWWEQYLRDGSGMQHETDSTLLKDVRKAFENTGEMTFEWSARLILATRNMQKLNW